MNSRAAGIFAAVRKSPPFDQSFEQLFFPAGLLGFSASRHYKLERFRPEDDSESPFFMLQAIDQDLSFPLIHPASIAMDFRYPVTSELLNALGATSAQDLMALLIVTLREPVEDITVNLKGPVIINVTKGLGLQLVIEQNELHHPLLPSASR